MDYFSRASDSLGENAAYKRPQTIPGELDKVLADHGEILSNKL